MPTGLRLAWVDLSPVGPRRRPWHAPEPGLRPLPSLRYRTAPAGSAPEVTAACRSHCDAPDVGGCLIRVRVREMLADVAHVDLPGLTGAIVIVNPGGDQALPGYLEMRIHENGAVWMYVPGNREYPQLPEFG